jgi:regulator of protease activity HflC (stomatin/prohibitin superfamily)
MDLITIVGVLAGVSWLAVLGAIGFTVVAASRGRGVRSGIIITVIVFIFAVALNTASAGLVFIQPYERGVVITVASGGIRPVELQPGLNWIIPFAENVIAYDTSNQTYTMSIAPQEGQLTGNDSVEARTSDGQVVHVDASVIFSVDPADVIDVHIAWQNNYVDNLVRPVARGVIRDAVSQFEIAEVYSTNRLELTEFMRQQLEIKFQEGGLILKDFVLRNIAFSDEYSASVEQKQIAEQLAQQAAFVVDQRKQEAEQARQVALGLADAAVTKAEGEATAAVIAATAEAEARLIQAQAEAEALEMLAEAIAVNPDVIILEYIQKLAPNISVMLVPSENPFLLPFPEVPDTTGLSVTPNPE